MKGLNLIIAIVGIVFCSAVWGKNQKLGIVWSKDGRTPDGQLTRERFEINTQGLVRWTTSAAEMICAKTAGIFQGTIAKDKQTLIVELAWQVLDEQKRTSHDPDSDSVDTSDASTIMRVAYKDKVQSVAISKLTVKTRKLKELIREVIQTLSPHQAVEFRIIPMKDHLLAVFKGIGSEDFKLILPDQAQKAFSHSGGEQLEYINPPAKEQYLLKDGTPSVEIKLKKFETDETLAMILYRNSSILHHGMRNVDKPTDTKAMEIDLCSDWHPKIKN